MCWHRGNGRSRGSMRLWTALRRFGSGFLRRTLGVRGGFRIRYTLQMFANFFCNFDGDRTGMRFLFRYAVTRQKVNDSFRLNLEFTGQFVDADLRCVAHAA